MSKPRLGEAIILGQMALDERSNSDWLAFKEEDVPGGKRHSCGCALGGALLVSGITHSVRSGFILEESRRLWPWLEDCHLQTITQLYSGVLNGIRTIEELAAIVDSWEPAHVEPEKQPYTLVERVEALVDAALVA